MPRDLVFSLTVALGLFSSNCALGQATADPFIPTIEALKHSVAPIVCLERRGSQTVISDIKGSAFFISRAGEFLTAAHVIDELRHLAGRACPIVAIYLPSGGWKPEVAEEDFQWFAFAIADCDENGYLDLARCATSVDISAPLEGFNFEVQPVSFEFSNQPDGTLVAFSGFPLRSNDPLTSRGNIAAYRRGKNGSPSEVVIDKAVWPGASGSPLYLHDGRVIGIIIQGGIGDGAGIAIARPARFIQQFLDEIGLPTPNHGGQ